MFFMLGVLCLRFSVFLGGFDMLLFLWDVWYIKDDPERSPYGFSWFSQQEGVVLMSFYTVHKGGLFQKICQNQVFATKSFQSSPKSISSMPLGLKLRADLEFRTENNPTV